MTIDPLKLQRARELLSQRGRKTKVSDEAVLDAYLEHYSIKAAAEALGVSSQTVQARLAKIIKESP